MNEALKQLSSGEQKQLVARQFPRWIEPMLATLTHTVFSDEAWVFERKLDGIRCLAYRNGQEIALYSRNRELLNPSYPELVEALAARCPFDAILDGEIVAFRGARSSFPRLQGRSKISDPDEARASAIAVFYYVFDLLYLDGQCVTALPLRARKRVLRNALDFSDPLRFLPHRNTAGEHYYQQACRKGREGVIAKRADSHYIKGRAKQWLKFKCVHRQELVIGGYTDPQGARIGFGALLLGYYAAGEFRYAGRVGTGFDDELLQNLHQRLQRIERDKPAYVDTEFSSRGVHWVAPELVGEIGFTEWTDDGRLRHPRFLGLRHDKDPQDVVREDTE